ncbi:amino acid ABC transporter substrate-binding protein [Eubacteriales bacterium OttesenSCG-928-N13]|nr:amino acid ABC transporter substrate-binding protein [Eubacteriales bacterium OttesenSCG-928-N13]
MKRVLALVLAMMMLLGGVAMADGSLQALTDRGQFILGLDDSFPPMGYRDENNDIVGFDIDLAREVCARLGVELVLQPIDWSAKEMELAAGNIDCIWNGMSSTPARQESMSCSINYMNNMIVFLTNNEANQSRADLVGKVVAVQTGSFAEEVLTTYEEYEEYKASLAEVRGYPDYLTAIMDMKNGNVDAILIDLVVANFRMASLNDPSLFTMDNLADDLYCIGFRKEDVALRDKVNEVLVEMQKDGKVDEIAATWFGENISIIPAE